MIDDEYMQPLYYARRNVGKMVMALLNPPISPNIVKIVYVFLSL